MIPEMRYFNYLITFVLFEVWLYSVFVPCALKLFFSYDLRNMIGLVEDALTSTLFAACAHKCLIINIVIISNRLF